VAYAVAYVEEEVVLPERRVRLFRNGRNQAVRIPRGYELPGKDAILRKEGEKLIVEPVPAKSLLSVLASLAPINEEFPEIADPHPRTVEL
jgi:antitoxin VapB